MIYFCQAYHQKLRKKPQRKLVGDYTFTFYESVVEIDIKAWDEVLQKHNFFLSIDYLDLMEGLHRDSFTSRYVIVYRHKIPIFICYFQIIDFTADVFGGMVESQISELESKRMKTFDKYMDKYKDHVIMRLVTCGNNFVSGPHCFAVRPDITKKETCFILEKVTNVIGKEEKLRGTISATLIKDFYPDEFPKHKILEENKFVDFSVEPNMIIDIPEKLSSVNDYINLFSKKYRNRAKHIFKAAEGVTKKDLEPEEIKKLETSINNLYNNVFEHAKFKLVKLAPTYFYEMKKLCPEHFFISGYFLNEEIVAFDSGFYLEDGTLEAHYIGLNYEYNKTYELYQNILYGFIEKAIQNSLAQVNLGRTASEIKSTVGARAHDLICFIKPQNTVSKVVLKPFMNFFQPAEWIPRNPFKED